MEVDGTPYLILEFVEGATLAEKLGEGPIPLERVLHLGSQIAVGLEAAHDKGIAHRDLKPAQTLRLRRTENSKYWTSVWQRLLTAAALNQIFIPSLRSPILGSSTAEYRAHRRT